MAEGGGDDRGVDDTVEVIRLEDLASVTHSVEEADLSKGDESKGKIIVIKEVEHVIKGIEHKGKKINHR